MAMALIPILALKILFEWYASIDLHIDFYAAEEQSGRHVPSDEIGGERGAHRGPLGRQSS